MSIHRFSGSSPRVLALATVLCVAVASEATAQRVIPGFGRIDQSDVTGPSVTSSDLANTAFGEPGTVQNIECAVGWGLRDATYSATQRFASASGGSGTALDNLQSVLLDDAGADPAAAALTSGLTANNAGARRPAARLVSELEGLFAELQEMDPRSAGATAATQIHLAVGHFNDLVDASSPAFLASPPEEFTAIRSVLAELVEGAAENEGRVGDPNHVDDRGFACAPVVTPAVTVTVAPAERPIEICMLRPTGEFEWVAAMYAPETGDTTVTVAGDRRPLTASFPERGRNAAGASWMLTQQEIDYNGSKYLPYGLPRTVEPEHVRRVGEHQGVSVFTLRDEAATAEFIYFPVSEGCEVQPFRRAEQVRQVRG